MNLDGHTHTHTHTHTVLQCLYVFPVDQDPPKGPVSSDKFLIQACVLTDTAKDLTMLWKSMSPSTVEESV